MICPHCRTAPHEGKPDDCPGAGQCNCQHRMPRQVPDPGCGAGVTPCGAIPSRLYACGYRCADHAP